MRAIEARLGDALARGGLDAITTTARGGRRFREDLLAEDRGARTLGDGPITPALLEAADASFTYDAVARRVARARLVRLLVALAAYLDPGDAAPPAARMASREPFERWLPRMIERGLISTHDLDDPWGHRFALRRVRSPALVLSVHGADVELASPGPDGRFGTRDDVRDPFSRAVDAGTPYAVASGEDRLMRRLAVLSPVERTLDALADSYTRVSAEMSEDEIGDVVAGDVSEATIGLGNLGTIGHGGGGGTGSGYGRGAGGLRSRSARVPRIRSGMARVRGLAAVVRERFPPTLRFEPSRPLATDGSTTIDIPLADAVTTYLVEVIVWREDGWVTSGHARIEVEREIVVSAPVPPVAHRGDRIELPVRVVNHGEAERELEVRLEGDDALGVEDAAAQRVTVPGGDARAVTVSLSPSRIGEGTITVAVVDPSGEALDATRLPMRVLGVARRVDHTEEAIAPGRAALDLTVPAAAEARSGRVEITVGTRLFGADEHAPPGSIWRAWAPSPGLPPAELPADLAHPAGSMGLAFSIGAAWEDDSIEDRAIERGIDQLTGVLERMERRSGADEDAATRAARGRAYALLGLSTIARSPGARDMPQARELVQRLRREVASQILAVSDPQAWAAGAAALSWTAEGDLEVPRELVRRLRRLEVRVGDDVWLAAEERAVRTTVLLAMAEVALGERARAFDLLATVERWGRGGHRLPPAERGLARATVRRLIRGEAPTEATVIVDGAAQTVELVDGSARIDAPELAAPGAHRIEVRAPSGAPLFVRVGARYAVPWSDPPDERGPLVITLDGELGGLDQNAELELTVRNRAPRTIAEPLIEIELPTGAELTDAMQAQIDAVVERSDDVLLLRLAPMRPGNERTLTLPLRWSVAGSLPGLAVSGRAADRPRAVTIVAPRTVDVAEVAQ